jgi:hypothetical protein
MWNKVKDQKTGELVPSDGLIIRRGQEATIFSHGVYPVINK